MSPDRWILQLLYLNTSIPNFLVHLVPWHPFSSSVGYLMSINGRSQWLVSIRCFIMFDLNTFIHMMGHVPSMISVEYLRLWSHSIYDTTSIATKPMGFQFSYHSSVLHYVLDVFIQYGDQNRLCILHGCDRLWHMYITNIHDHCTYMYLGLLYVLQICSHVHKVIIVLWWQVASSSTWIFATPLLGLL